MKQFFKIFLVLTLCVLLFAACDDKGGEGATTTTPQGGGDVTPPASTEQVLIGADGSTNYAVITQKGMNSSSLSLVRDFISDVQKKTGVRFTQKQETAQPESDYEITINVTRDRGDAADLFTRTAYTNYRIERNGNRIMIVAFSDTILEDALEALYDQITKNTETGEWVIPSGFRANEFGFTKSRKELAMMNEAQLAAYYNFIGAVSSVPKVETQMGALQPLYSLGSDAYAVAIKNATKSEYDAYVAKLGESGFTLYTANTMSAGDKVEEKNTYHFFTAEKIYVYTQYQPNLKVIRVYFMPPQALPSTTPPTLTATDTVPVTIAQMQLAYASFGGMSYVYQLADGKFIIADGGVYDSLTQQILINYLNTKAAEAGMQKPVIAMWIVSHLHGDHYGTLLDGFIEYAYENGIKIESFAYNFADQKNATDGDSTTLSSLTGLMTDFFPDAPQYHMHAGQVYYFKGLTLEVLATQEELYPFESDKNVTQNSLCVTWRVFYDSGKSAMFLADNTVHINAQLAKVYREYLKSDILQVAHHGLSGGELSCYQYVDPDICLWPSPYERFMGIYGGTLFGGTLDKDQWGLGFQYAVNDNGQPIDEKGNVVTDPSLAKKNRISEANIWLLDESIKKRYDYHNSETVVIGADLSVKIIRTADSGQKNFTLPELPSDHSQMDYKSGVIPFVPPVEEPEEK